MLELQEKLDHVLPASLTGSVAQTVGMAVAVAGFPAPLGAVVEIQRHSGQPMMGEVVGFRDELTMVYPLSELAGIRPGSRVELVQTSRTVPVGDSLLGRVVDALGRPLDGGPPAPMTQRKRLQAEAPPALGRPPIDAPLGTGIRAVDAMLSCGRGQRIGIFAGSGVGKSVLLGMMAKYTSADVNVISLIGERGREVNEFIQRELGPEGLKKSVVVVATGDQPALSRVQSAMAATTIAEHFRDMGRDVLLVMDSLTRFAMAQREIGLAAGEPPATRGYPPSVFAMLPKLVERAGRTGQGSITAFYSVLVEGDDTNEPISDAVRGLLDGHVVLSRELAGRGHYPAIDVLQSISRLMPQVTAEDHRAAAAQVRQLMSALRDHEDLISIGAYRPGSNPLVDTAVANQEAIDALLKQGMQEQATWPESVAALKQLVETAQARLQQQLRTQVAAQQNQAGGAQPRAEVTN